MMSGSSQTSVAGPTQALNNLVLPVSGAPVRLEILEQETRRDPSHEIARTNRNTVVYRDGFGRIRIESKTDLESPTVISDPVAKFTAILLVQLKMAYRMKGAVHQGSTIHAMDNPLVAIQGSKSFEKASLGNKVIEGIQFEGVRLTTTLVDDPSVKATQEIWTSSSLGLIGSVKSWSSTGIEITTQIFNVDLQAKIDPSFFVVPRDFKIQDMTAADTGSQPQ